MLVSEGCAMAMLGPGQFGWARAVKLGSDIGHTRAALNAMSGFVALLN